MTDQMKKDLLAGFDLAGQRLENGDIKSYLSETTMKDWPKEAMHLNEFLETAVYA